MDFGELVFLNCNFYERDGQPRCYAQFAALDTGEVYSFACHQWQKSDQPPLFGICSVKGKMRQFGKSVSFTLDTYQLVGQLQ